MKLSAKVIAAFLKYISKIVILLSDSSYAIDLTTVSKPTVPPLVESRTPLAPDSGQRLRLRGGSGPWEGYLEFREQKGHSWGHVCLAKEKFTFNEANTICRHLGFDW